ncbi:MAG: DUF790 family protein [Candidatus Thorarchaeota archaeon]|nr:DUF790 family protein [Candidatus Thorarchaeota archaeon]
MLPTSLLLVRRSADRIQPLFLETTAETSELAEQVKKVFASSIGKSKRDIREHLHRLEEDTDWDFRVVRGLGSVFERRCVFEQVAPVSPMTARETVFMTSASQGLPTNSEARAMVLQRAAQALHVTVEDLESSLYADLDDNLYLSAVNALPATRLIGDYNVSLLQTLLFRASRLDLTTDNWKGVFRALRGLGLMYTATRRDDAYSVTVEGPLSVVRQTTRYGARFARLVPSVIASEKWSIEAEISDGPRGGRTRHLRLDSQTHGQYLPRDISDHVESFDSDVEQDFANRFRRLDTGWELVREPGPLQAGEAVMLPDFVFRRHGVEVYLEIVGFWTPEYLARKWEKVRHLEGVDIILAVDEANICDELASLPQHVSVVLYKREVPLAPVLARLRERDEQIRREHTSRLSAIPIEIRVPSITVDALARELDVDPDALREHLRGKELADHVLAVDTIVAKSVLSCVSAKMTERMRRGPLTVADAFELVKECGGVSPERILNHLGYIADWSSLDMSEALIVKVDQ